MKKLLVTLSAVAFAVGAFAQGTISFTTFSTANGVNAKVFNDDKVTPLAGSSFYAQLYAAQGAGASASSLQAGTPTTTFRTGSAAGYVNLTTVSFNNIAKDFAGFTVQMFVWDNSSGLYNTWEQAKVAYEAKQIKAGWSSLLSFNSKIGGDQTSPPYLTGLQSFNIAMIPEPSSMALAGLGAAALLIFRRRK